MGAINGVIVAYGRVPAIITTLGTLAIFRVVLVEVSGAKTVTTHGFPTGCMTSTASIVASFGDFDIRCPRS